MRVMMKTMGIPNIILKVRNALSSRLVFSLRDILVQQKRAHSETEQQDEIREQGRHGVSQVISPLYPFPYNEPRWQTMNWLSQRNMRNDDASDEITHAEEDGDDEEGELLLVQRHFKRIYLGKNGVKVCVVNVAGRLFRYVVSC